MPLQFWRTRFSSKFFRVFQGGRVAPYQPATEPAAREFAATGCLVGRRSSKPEQGGGLLDRERCLPVDLVDGEGRSLLHVGTSFVGLGQAPGCSRTAGADLLYDYICNLSRPSDGSDYGCNLRRVAPRVNTEDLIDARGVAEILGLAHRNTVSVYQRRYAEMPRPVVDLGPVRTKLWLRPEVERWAASRVDRRARTAE